MTYLGLMEAEAERRETQRIGKRIGPGAVFSCGGNSASNSMSPGQGYLFVKCSPEHPSRSLINCIDNTSRDLLVCNQFLRASLVAQW